MVWRLGRFLILATPLVSLLFLAGFFYYGSDLPDISTIEKRSAPSVIFLDAQSTPLAVRGGNFHGIAVTWESLPKHLIDALVATEDRRFFEHAGWDWRGILRALWVNVWAGQIVEGGSTLTQQLAKNLFLSSRRDMKRKIQEWLLAVLLELKYDKQEILTLYVNRAYMGNGLWGIGAAAAAYFGKSVTQLDIYESALLVGLLRAPTRYAPSHNVSLAHERTKQVLENMVEDNRLSRSQARYLAQHRFPPKPQLVSRQHVHYFVDWAYARLSELIGTVDEDVIVHTTLDVALQDKSHEALADMLASYGADHDVSQAAVVLMDLSGGIKAMLGGRDYNESQFNRVSQAYRQPGSAFKLFVYLAALEAEVGPDTFVLDAPLYIDGWSPSNYDEHYHGEVSLRQAFSLSLNTATVRVSEYIGRDHVIAMAQRLGIRSRLAAHPSVALGTLGVNVLELTSAYGVVANGGRRFHPWGISLVRSRDGSQVYYRRPDTASESLLRQQDVALMRSLLVDAVQFGTGKRARMKRSVGGKTGTSQQARDAWFIGFTADYIGGIWFGNDDETAMTDVTGGNGPARLWHDIMFDAHKGFPATAFPQQAVSAQKRLRRIPSEWLPNTIKGSEQNQQKGTIRNLMEQLGL